MTKEQIFFLQIIKDYISVERTKSIEDIDWQQIWDYAQSHQLSAIIYAKCKDIIPVNLVKDFRTAFYATISQNARRKTVVDELINSLMAAGVNCFVVKGNVIANYYTNWQYRTMGDADIVVDNREVAHKIMLQKGFTPIALSDDSEWKYKKNDCEIEVHDRLIYSSDDVANEKVVSFFNYYKPYVKNNSLDLNYHFAYLVLHLRKHFMKYGVGFRQFLDIAMTTKNCDGLDWSIVVDYLNESGLYDFARMVCGFNECWFGVASPFEKVEINDVVIEKSTDYIFANGVFGFDNDDNKKRLQMIRSQKKQLPLLYMCKDGLSKIFLPYSSMIKLEYCSFLVGKPILLPIAWLKRVMHTIRNKGIKAGTDQISNSFVSPNYIAKHEEMFRIWGLQ